MGTASGGGTLEVSEGSLVVDGKCVLMGWT